MTLAPVLLLLAPMAAQAASGSAAPATKAAHASARAPSSGPSATVSASAKIVRPVSVRVRADDGKIEVDAPRARKPQAERDTRGTLWIEFS
ncbi:MAG: hypothetical protein AAF291_08105 [Pseudomonadota bacterium]